MFLDNQDNSLKQIEDLIPKKSLQKLLDPSCEVVGKGLAGIFTYVFQKPIKYYILQKPYFDDLVNGATDQISKIPSKNLDKSKSEKVLNIIEHSKYSISDDEIRELYKKIIANSFDNRKNKEINNFFSYVLSNLTNEAAQLLKIIYKSNRIWINYMNIYETERIKINTKTYMPQNTIYKGLVYNPYKKEILECKSAIDLLTTLGLVEHGTPGKTKKTDRQNKEIKKKAVKEIINCNLNNKFKHIHLHNLWFADQGLILNDLGQSFAHLVFD